MSKSDKKAVTLPKEVSDGTTAIAARNLCFTYNPKAPFAKQALDNVELTVNRGEFVAVVGRTGSGKTTFVQHLNALIRVQNGGLYVLQYNLSAKKVELKALRGDVGMVFQYPEYQLFADTVLEDVCFGLKNSGIDKDKRVEMARSALELVGLDFDKVKAKSPFDLSGGEKRRVALAGVLAMQPKILVLDEPTAGLDPRGKKEILSIVSALNKEQGVTVVMVSHDMNEVYENADRIIVFCDGKVAYDDSPRELFRKEDEIVSMNLEIPHMAKFANELERRGYPIPDGCKTVESVYEAVMKLYGGGDA
ncbi:MAG: energy-coupling factor transporter ATPase [Corallococcus sp.]|nr:energy-coupling factor transporter ATPase [Bacillota bacterium]MCM1533124.1 energy-coupling factor transporter ATPase [Corallococcus sp.]